MPTLPAKVNWDIHVHVKTLRFEKVVKFETKLVQILNGFLEGNFLSY